MVSSIGLGSPTAAVTPSVTQAAAAQTAPVAVNGPAAQHDAFTISSAGQAASAGMDRDGDHDGH